MDFVRMALDAGVLGIHLRTELQCSKELVQEIATSGVGVVSVELNADSPQTYLQTMGHDGYATVMANIEELIRCRRSVCGSGAGAFALPWIVPRIQRCFDTYEDIEPFFERWQSVLGTPVIDPQIVIDPLEEDASTTLADASNPARAMVSECFRRMTIQSDGWVPTSELDLNGTRTVGNVGELSIIELWRRVIHERRRALREDGPLAFQLRTYQP
jgi:MoaA/NifB/PqqE/SkfB family radical SAM enzyme